MSVEGKRMKFFQEIMVSSVLVKREDAIEAIVEKPDRNSILYRRDFNVWGEVYAVPGGLYADFQAIMGRCRKKLAEERMDEEVSIRSVSRVFFNELMSCKSIDVELRPRRMPLPTTPDKNLLPKPIIKQPYNVELLVFDRDTVYRVSERRGWGEISSGFAVGPKAPLVIALENPSLGLVERLWGTNIYSFTI